MKTRKLNWMMLAALFAAPALTAAERPLRISVAEYQDKVYASWLGQCIGNIYGLPHESIYNDKPGPADFPYGYRDRASIPGRAFNPDFQILRRMREANGCFSDDDTDIEYMYMLGMEKFGPEPRYKDLASLWKYHVRDRVWIANLAALSLMHYGYTPPQTGARGNNEHWFQIDPQLINEIWGVAAPGMTRYAAEKSLWAARVMADGWGVDPTVHYGAMYAAAFFEQDVEKLIDIGTRSLPPGNRFARTVEDMKALYKKYPDDWQRARAELAEKYYTQEPPETRTITNANLNGAAGILALLFGRGDFQRTLDLACAIGFDADNQAATVAGLLAVVHGTKGIPRDLLFPPSMQDRGWKEPFNDLYKNVSRYDLPDGSLKDMGRRTALQGEKILLAHGGKKVTENGIGYYLINRDAAFVPPFELPVGPAPMVEAGKPVRHEFTTVGGKAPVSWRLASGSLPAGLAFSRGVLSGTASAAGVFPITIEARSGTESDRLAFSLAARSANLAAKAAAILTPPSEPGPETAGRRPRGPAFSVDPEALRDGRCTGAASTFRSMARQGDTSRQQYGYRWAESQDVGIVSFCPGPGQDAAWYRTMAVEFEDGSGAWHPVQKLRSTPALPVNEGPYDKAAGVEYLLTFEPVRARAIRIGGDPPPASSRSRATSLGELRVYAPLPGAIDSKMGRSAGN